MTSPSKQTPAGFLNGYGGIKAWSEKTRGEYENEILNKVNGSTLKLGGFFSRFNGVEGQITDDFVDGQRTLKGRVELMEDVSGFCSVVMSKTWTLNGNALNGFARAMPFDSEVGEGKNAVPYYGYFHGTNDRRYGILLQASGTWRLDAQVTPDAVTGQKPAQFYLSAWNKDTRTVYSERRFDTVILANRLSNTIAHTVIVPPELAGKLVVCVSFATSGSWPVLGGDRWSGLSVNRWDLNSGGNQNNPNEPVNGGNYD